MNTYFIIIITMILIIFYIYNNNGLINIEPFCTKKSSNKCLNRFTYPVQLPNSQSVVLRNNSVGPTTITNNEQTEKLMNFRCVPNNYPNNTSNTDCNIWSNVPNANRSRDNDARDWFPADAYYFNCQNNGMGTPGCAGGYTALGLKSYKDFGYSCNLGNGKIPTKLNSSTEQITCATDESGECLVRESQEKCNSMLNLIPVDKTGKNAVNELTCTDGKIGNECINMYNNLEIDTLKDNNYNCNTFIAKNELPGKVQNNNSYLFASNDGNKIIDNCPKNINFQPKNSLKPIVCSEYKTVVDTEHPTACEQAFTRFNLFPSTNPLVIKGNDPNYGISGTFDNSSSLFGIFSKYQNAFPSNTNSNSSSSIKDGIETILSETPIKLGCCRRRNSSVNTPINVNVRVPVNPTVESINPFTKTFNFQNSQIVLPENSCPTDMYWGSQKCDNFFGLYCDNIINYMKSQNINVEKELINYAPECACYAPQTESQSGFPSTTPAVCYKNGCDFSSNPSVYIDPSSRNGNTVKTCDMTVCNSINNFSNMTIGGSANISPQTQNQCGGSSPSPSPSPTNTNTASNSSSTSTNTNTASNSSSTNTNTADDSTSPNNGDTSNVESDSQSDSQSDSSNYIIISIVIFVLLLISSIFGYFFSGKKK